MRRISIATLLALAMGGVLALLCGLGVSAWRGFAEVTDAFRQANDVTVASTRSVDAILVAKRTMQAGLTLLQVPSVEYAARNGIGQRLADGRFELEAAISKLDKLPRDPATDRAWTAAKGALTAFSDATEDARTALEPVDDLLRSGRRPDPRSWPRPRRRRGRSSSAPSSSPRRQRNRWRRSAMRSRSGWAPMRAAWGRARGSAAGSSWG